MPIEIMVSLDYLRKMGGVGGGALFVVEMDLRVVKLRVVEFLLEIVHQTAYAGTLAILVRGRHVCREI